MHHKYLCHLFNYRTLFSHPFFNLQSFITHHSFTSSLFPSLHIITLDYIQS
ncbi:hypothetical protein Hanom_Chr04g00339351 [Helianthus anomalus]